MAAVPLTYLPHQLRLKLKGTAEPVDAGAPHLQRMDMKKIAIIIKASHVLCHIGK